MLMDRTTLIRYVTASVLLVIGALSLSAPSPDADNSAPVIGLGRLSDIEVTP